MVKTVVFRTAAGDARFFAAEFAGPFELRDFLTLPNFDCYVRLLVGDEPGRAFSATTAGSLTVSR